MPRRRHGNACRKSCACCVSCIRTPPVRWTMTSPLQLLVATILSAQCTDERVNKVTPVLFARYPSAQALAEADRTELEEIIHSTGFYRNKAKNVQEACRRIVTEYGGEVPTNMVDLLSLAGCAREDGERRPGQLLQHCRRHRRRHACKAPVAAPGVDDADRP